MRFACSTAAFVDGGLSFGSLDSHHKFLHLFVEIVERDLVYAFSLVHRRAIWLMSARLDGCSNVADRNEWPYSLLS